MELLLLELASKMGYWLAGVVQWAIVIVSIVVAIIIIWAIAKATTYYKKKLHKKEQEAKPREPLEQEIKIKCPKCGQLISIAYDDCPYCGHKQQP